MRMGYDDGWDHGHDEGYIKGKKEGLKVAREENLDCSFQLRDSLFQLVSSPYDFYRLKMLFVDIGYSIQKTGSDNMIN